MKKCSKCKIDKEDSEFHKDAQKKDGLRSSCKDCESARKKSFYIKNKEPIKEQQSEYREKDISTV